jgi:4-diphosphocytidyl-2-C-methyl-D-erythritol kinase
MVAACRPPGRLAAAEVMRVRAFAPAKVNLYLHVIGRRADGYHLLDSLVAFADVGDCIVAEEATDFSLEVSGPEAGALTAAGEDNLVLRAARLLAAHTGISTGAALHLEKRLPVAAGIGGGSSDAAATMRALRDLWRIAVDDATLRALAAGLGADVPACISGCAVWVGGIGERIELAVALPKAGILFANPRRNLPTAAVFAARRGSFGQPGRFGQMPADAAGLGQILMRRRNDLTDAAIGLVPEIATVLARLATLPGALLARMSGSGATCFALFGDCYEAESAGKIFLAAEPLWWCAAGSLVAAQKLSG